MTSVAATSLAGVLAPAEPRQPEPAQSAAEPEGAAFASLLAALVAPAPAIALATQAPTVDGVSELDVEEQNAAEQENAGDATAATLASATGVSARRESRDDTKDDDADTTGDDAAASLIDASRAMAATVAASLEPVKSPDALDPEFREKLGRVVSRMRELGHEVRVVETVRSQARQEKLFAQGRTAPGPVVTWTRNSNHTQGRAADVTIDGRYDGEGFQTLQRVAREAGLHTLGARDPGHLELPKGMGDPAASRGASLRQAALESIESQPVATPGVQRPQSVATAQLAAVAQIATVAQVAAVSSVAQPARVAAAAAPASTKPTEPAALVRPTTRGTTATAVDGDARAIVRAALRRSARDGAESHERDGRKGEDSARLDALATALGAGGTRGGAAFGEGLAAAQGLTRSDAASRTERIERVLAAQDMVKGRPLHELTLALDGSDAGVESVRIGVTGRTVGATFETSDDASAARIGARLDELTRALERAGLEPEALRVRGAESRDALREIAKEAAGREAARAATVQVAESSRGTGTQTDQRQSSQRERDAWAQQDDRGQQGRGRNRSRREQHETTE